jgi:hypothetical protein
MRGASISKLKKSKSFSSTARHSDDKPDNASSTPFQPPEEQGALSRRLSEMAEDTLNTGSNSDRKLMSEAGFSEDLKKQLEERIAQTAFTSANQQAASIINLPTAAGAGTRDHASATPWTGDESTPDAALRMLDDTHKRLRQPFRPPPVRMRAPAPQKKVSTADRLANARDKTSIYAFSQQSELSDQEREKMRKEMKERFTPGARPMPTTLQGLSSLANERIEDAIARGQFKNISRGKGINVERDYNANSPFLDTTEYFMNKIIQKQEIVPPWIEKQQELVKETGRFRGRLRNDWKRHAARMISASGGSVSEQVRRAQGYAMAEEVVNPRPKRRVENVSAIASDGSLTTISVEERIAAGVDAGQVDAMEHRQPEASPSQPPDIEIKVTEAPAEITPVSSAAPDPLITTTSSSPPSTSDAPSQARVLPTAHPFRDPQWERTENSYHNLAISSLNTLTRSYNLMAPKIAQKPYLSLQRELLRCYADVAPELADTILERARNPRKATVNISVSGGTGGVLEKVGGERWRGHEGVIRDEGTEKGYGFKEFWRDLFSRKEKSRDLS